MKESPKCAKLACFFASARQDSINDIIIAYETRVFNHKFMKLFDPFVKVGARKWLAKPLSGVVI